MRIYPCDYQKLRKTIRDGDIVGVAGVTWFARLTAILQKIAYPQSRNTDISHVGIAGWHGDKLFLLEMDGRWNVARPLSQHIEKANFIEVKVSPCGSNAMMSCFSKMMNEAVHYEQVEILQIGLRLLLKVKAKDVKAGEVCSTFATKWLQKSGWKPPEEFPSLPSPSEVIDAL